MSNSVFIPLAVIAPIVLTVGLGILLAWLGPFLTRYFRTNVPSEAAMKSLNAAVYAPRERKPAKPIAPNREPLILGGIGFIAFIILGFMFLRPDAAHVRAEDNKKLAEVAAAQAEAAKGPTLVVVKSAAEADAELAKLPAGNAADGEKQFTLAGCVGCHAQEKDKKLVGPSFYGLFIRAANGKPGYSAKAYLYESIVNPNEHVVEGYQPNIMQQTYAKTLSQQNMADLLAWIEKAHSEK